MFSVLLLVSSIFALPHQQYDTSSYNNIRVVKEPSHNLVREGAGIGAGVGALGGAVFGLEAARGNLGRMVIGAGLGALGGATAGATGGAILKNMRERGI